MLRSSVRAAFAVASLLALYGVAQASPSIKWARSLPDAMRKARASDQIVMVDFYADWCTYCKLMDTTTYRSPAVRRLADGLLPVKLNSEREGLSEARRFSVRGLPTLLFLNRDGDVEFRVAGYVKPELMLSILKQVIRSHQLVARNEARLRANPGDGAAAFGLIRIFCARRDAGHALDILHRMEAADPRGRSDLLPKAYDAVGSVLLNVGQADRAMPYLQKAVRLCRDPVDVAFAHVGLAACYTSGSKLDFKRAAAELSKVVSNPKAPERLKAHAMKSLAEMKREGVL